MKKVQFIKDFATKKKGDVDQYDSMLAHSLVAKKVAKYVKEENGKPD